MGGFPKLGLPFQGTTIRTIVFGVLCWRPSILGNYQIHSLKLIITGGFVGNKGIKFLDNLCTIPIQSLPSLIPY